MPDQLITSG